MEKTVYIPLITGLWYLFWYLIFAALASPIIIFLCYIIVYAFTRYLTPSWRGEVYSGLFFYWGDPAKFGWRDVFSWAKAMLLYILLYSVGTVFRAKRIKDKAERYISSWTEKQLNK